jgi:hypothetical protein
MLGIQTLAEKISYFLFLIPRKRGEPNIRRGEGRGIKGKDD